MKLRSDTEYDNDQLRAIHERQVPAERKASTHSGGDEVMDWAEQMLAMWMRRRHGPH